MKIIKLKLTANRRKLYQKTTNLNKSRTNLDFYLGTSFIKGQITRYRLL